MNHDAQYRIIAIEQRDDDAGTFDGIASHVLVEDSYGTAWDGGAWTAGTPDLTDRTFPLLWMHDPFVPIGTFTAEETEHGLRIRGTYDDTEAGRDARKRAKSKSAPNLSVGFIPKQSRSSSTAEFDGRDVEVFTATQLVETSQITLGFQAVPGAELTSARSNLCPYCGAAREAARSSKIDEALRDVDDARARARLLLAGH